MSLAPSIQPSPSFAFTPSPTGFCQPSPAYNKNSFNNLNSTSSPQQPKPRTSPLGLPSLN